MESKDKINQVNALFTAYLKTIPNDGTNFIYPEDGPITSISQKQIIESLINTKDYLVIRSGDTVHTLGLWFLHRIPELIIHKDIMVPNIINEYLDRVDKTDKTDKYGELNLKIYNTNIKLELVQEDEYFCSKMNNLLWFYTYYVEAEKIENLVIPEEASKYIEDMDGLEYKLWPTYEIKDLSALDTLNKIQSSIDSNIGLNYDEFSESDHLEYSD